MKQQPIELAVMTEQSLLLCMQDQSRKEPGPA